MRQQSYQRRNVLLLCILCGTLQPLRFLLPWVRRLAGAAWYVIQFWQEDDAFLLIGIRASDHRLAWLGLAAVGGQVRHARWAEEKLTRAADEILAQTLAVPHVGLAAQHVKCRSALSVQRRLGQAARRNGAQRPP